MGEWGRERKREKKINSQRGRSENIYEEKTECQTISSRSHARALSLSPSLCRSPFSPAPLPPRACTSQRVVVIWREWGFFVVLFFYFFRFCAFFYGSRLLAQPYCVDIRRKKNSPFPTSAQLLRRRSSTVCTAHSRNSTEWNPTADPAATFSESKRPPAAAIGTNATKKAAATALPNSGTPPAATAPATAAELSSLSTTAAAQRQNTTPSTASTPSQSDRKNRHSDPRCSPAGTSTAASATATRHTCPAECAARRRRRAPPSAPPAPTGIAPTNSMRGVTYDRLSPDTSRTSRLSTYVPSSRCRSTTPPPLPLSAACVLAYHGTVSTAHTAA
eukprot:Rhum_TRINITY_DN14773_c32_g1::Rhum_TRINITY_DN14773_c32_g1_i1::g.117399::m.117399